MKKLYNIVGIMVCIVVISNSLHGQRNGACNACRNGNPAVLPKQLRERCAKGYPLAFSKIQSGPWWPQDPRYPNWDYYFNNKEPRPDMGYGITPK